MRAALFAGTVIALLGAQEAWASPFCVVSSYGRDCSYSSLSACQNRARSIDGACVANAGEQAPQTSVAPPAPSGRPYADVAGSFQRGRDAAEQRRFDQESRALELERQRLENDRLRLSMAPPPPKPEETAAPDLFDVATVSNLRSMPAQNRIVARAEPSPNAVTVEDIARCEPLREAINRTRLARTDADVAQLSALDDMRESGLYSSCIFQMP